MPLEEDIALLLDPSPHLWKQRLAAAHRIGQTPLSAGETRKATYALLDVLANEVPGDTRNAREAWCYRWLLFVPFLMGGLCAVVGALWSAMLSDAAGEQATSTKPTLELSDWMLGALGAVWIAGICLPPLVRAALLDREDRRVNRLRAAAIEALGRLRAAETCGVLAGVLFAPNMRLARAARKALKAVMPALTPDHYGALEASAVPNLCRALEHSDDEVVLLTLEALGSVGDGRAVRTVEAVTRRGRTGAIRQAAEAILPILRERQQQENDQRMLLRASSPARDTLHLLHAIASQEPPEQLLRPTPK